MGIARDLVALERSLRTAKGVDLFAPIERSGLLESPDVAQILPIMEGADVTHAISVLRLCLQALRIQFGELSPQLIRTELVATLPSDLPGIARTTKAVVREMLQSCAREAILLGYELSDEDTVEFLGRAASAGASITMICDRVRGSAQRVLGGWPQGVPSPRVFHDRSRAGAARYSSMHAKCLLVDGTDLLITSANFTFHGLQGNVEIGVRLSGPPAAEARKIFSYLIERGVVEEVK